MQDNVYLVKKLQITMNNESKIVNIVGVVLNNVYLVKKLQITMKKSKIADNVGVVDGDRVVGAGVDIMLSLQLDSVAVFSTSEEFPLSSQTSLKAWLPLKARNIMVF